MDAPTGRTSLPLVLRGLARAVARRGWVPRLVAVAVVAMVLPVVAVVLMQSPRPLDASRVETTPAAPPASTSAPRTAEQYMQAWVQKDADRIWAHAGEGAKQQFAALGITSLEQLESVMQEMRRDGRGPKEYRYLGGQPLQNGGHLAAYWVRIVQEGGREGEVGWLLYLGPDGKIERFE